MGLTVAEVELSRLDQERIRDRVTLERERSYAENIISKIEDILYVPPNTQTHCIIMNAVQLLSASRPSFSSLCRLTTQTTEEEKW